MPRMLIVDDEPKICECLQAHFAARGMTVQTALNGQDALEILMNDAPQDFLLLDIRLPDMKGIEVLKRAKELCPDAKVFMVTALDDEGPRMEAKAYGAHGYITKPFDLSEATWAPVLFEDAPGRSAGFC